MPTASDTGVGRLASRWQVGCGEHYVSCRSNLTQTEAHHIRVRLSGVELRGQPCGCTGHRTARVQACYEGMLAARWVGGKACVRPLSHHSLLVCSTLHSADSAARMRWERVFTGPAYGSANASGSAWTIRTMRPFVLDSALFALSCGHSFPICAKPWPLRAQSEPRSAA